MDCVRYTLDDKSLTKEDIIKEFSKDNVLNLFLYISVMSHPTLGRRFVTFLESKDIVVKQYSSGCIQCRLAQTV